MAARVCVGMPSNGDGGPFWLTSRFNFQDKTIAYKKKKQSADANCLILGDPRGARTHDPNIKSVVLYLLS